MRGGVVPRSEPEVTMMMLDALTGLISLLSLSLTLLLSLLLSLLLLLLLLLAAAAAVLDWVSVLPFGMAWLGATGRSSIEC